MARAHCRFSDQAKRDLDEILLYVARDKPRAALELVDRIEQRCRIQLADFPLSAPARHDLGRYVRVSVIRPYLILYRPVENGVYILRIVHCARRLTRGLLGES